MTSPLRIGVSACVFHRDRNRTTFHGRPLLYLEQSMGDWIMSFGAVPLLIPFATGDRPVAVSASDFVAAVDGVVLQGGVDVAPQSYGEQPIDPRWSGDPVRDAYEIELVEECIEQNKPVLGICRGHQVVNVALGGTLYQDINTQVPESLVHRNAEIYEKNFHELTFTPGSVLQQIYDGLATAKINSVHHQAIKDVAEGLVVEGRSTVDDIIEAVRLPSEGHEDPWVAGVQWHPEFQDVRDETILSTRPLFEHFQQACRDRL